MRLAFLLSLLPLLSLSSFSNPCRIQKEVVYFSYDSALLYGAEKEKLLRLPKTDVIVIGYSSPEGVSRYNYKLSLKRAFSVRNFLGRGIAFGVGEEGCSEKEKRLWWRCRKAEVYFLSCPSEMRGEKKETKEREEGGGEKKRKLLIEADVRGYFGGATYSEVYDNGNSDWESSFFGGRLKVRAGFPYLYLTASRSSYVSQRGVEFWSDNGQRNYLRDSVTVSRFGVGTGYDRGSHSAYGELFYFNGKHSQKRWSFLLGGVFYDLSVDEVGKGEGYGIEAGYRYGNTWFVGVEGEYGKSQSWKVWNSYANLNFSTEMTYYRAAFLGGRRWSRVEVYGGFELFSMHVDRSEYRGSGSGGGGNFYSPPPPSSGGGISFEFGTVGWTLPKNTTTYHSLFLGLTFRF